MSGAPNWSINYIVSLWNLLKYRMDFENSLAIAWGDDVHRNNYSVYLQPHYQPHLRKRHESGTKQVAHVDSREQRSLRNPFFIKGRCVLQRLLRNPFSKNIELRRLRPLFESLLVRLFRMLNLISFAVRTFTSGLRFAIKGTKSDTPTKSSSKSRWLGRHRPRFEALLVRLLRILN